MNLINELLAETTPQEQQRVHDRMMLAARIADALAAKGWTQKRLATELGKSASEVSKWLSGTHNFTTDTLSDLSHVLGVKLLCVKDEPAAEPQLITRYQYFMISVGRNQPARNVVMWDNFRNSIGQLQPNG